MEPAQFAQNYLNRLSELLQKIDSKAIGLAIEWIREARDKGRTIYTCGNGGSASIASQIVVDFAKGASLKREPRFKIMALTDSVATITAYADDFDYDCVFEQPLRNFAQAGDILLAVSGSGNSPNVLRAVEYANGIGCRTVGLTTSEGGRLKEISQLPLVVPGGHMGRLEDCFFVLTHIFCYAFIEEVC